MAFIIKTLNSKALDSKQLISIGLLTAMAGTILLSGPSWADQTIRNLKRPIEVQLETPAQSEHTMVGQPFAARLVDPVHYQNLTLPAGTEFKGHVSKFGHSRHFGRPGYVVLQTDEAILPNGQTLHFDADKYPPRNRALHHPDTETFFQSVGIQAVYSVASLGVTLPLHYAGGTDWGPLLIVGEGVRMLTGAVVGLFRPKFKNDPIPGKIAKGALDGSGIPRVVGFIGTYPEPDYHPGDKVKLYLNPKGFNDLLQTSRVAASVRPATFPKTASQKSSTLTLAEPLPLKQVSP